MMSLCTECRKSPWPFVFIIVIASVSTFLTWLTFSFAQSDELVRIGASAGMFIVVSGGLLSYVMSCLRRHCRH
ncbi:hypothetical protein HUK38_08510 [Thiospirillum jenense]|uniref:Uncharacterized protein n=2 Tax=Thiospirillum jenense TaxID=1653858 RepID=A0A839HK48_9GAMM|nr:hypothetical protein [Thiospirillum jenense]